MLGGCAWKTRLVEACAEVKDAFVRHVALTSIGFHDTTLATAHSPKRTDNTQATGFPKRIKNLKLLVAFMFPRIPCPSGQIAWPRRCWCKRIVASRQGTKFSTNTVSSCCVARFLLKVSRYSRRSLASLEVPGRFPSSGFLFGTMTKGK